MKNLTKKIWLTILISLNLYVVNAKDDKNVRLFVTGQGNSIEEAKTMAFRSAIEQAFGLFISSKTEVLNDEMIKDEIISTSSGNIKSFDIVSQMQLKNDSYLVNMNVEVSKNKLLSFCTKKAISIEFDGANLAANARLNNLYQKNELMAIQNLEKELNQIFSEPFNFKLSYKIPKVKYGNNHSLSIPIDIDVISSDNFKQAINYIFNTLKGISLKDDLNEISSDPSIVNGYSIDLNGKSQMYFFRNEYVLEFIEKLSNKIRNKLSDFNLYSNDIVLIEPSQTDIDKYNNDKMFIGRWFYELINNDHTGLFYGGFELKNQSEIGCFEIKVDNTLQKIRYYEKKCLGFYTINPSNIRSNNTIGYLFDLNKSESFYPFSLLTSLRNTKKPYFLFSVVIENKNNVIAKHKFNLQLNLEQLDKINQISIKPGINF